MRWYHTIELPDGTTTPGEYDLRPVADRLPWPELQGRADGRGARGRRRCACSSAR